LPRSRPEHHRQHERGGPDAVNLTHQRQRGEGGDPVGVSSSTKAVQASMITNVAALPTAA
jgi:hypothetical protein